MSFEKIKNPLEKILDRLHSLKDKEELSRLDRDHIGNLLIQAYDKLYAIEEEATQPAKAVKHEIFEFEEDQAAAQSQEEPVKEGKEEKEEKKEMEKPAPPPEDSLAKKPAKEEAEVHAEKKETEVVSSQRESSSSELESLFKIKESTELSERLSQLPISDIWNAMGLNERIFTQNELFDGDHEDFQSTVQKLNGLSNFEEAKEELLNGAAKEYDWASSDRKNIAKNFIRLVKRRYK